MRIRTLVSLAAMSLSAGQLLAQNSPQMSPAAAVPQWRSFLGANPLGIPFDIVSLEAETSVSSGGTIGAVAAYNDFDNRRFTTVDVRGKYYPGEIAMRGFAIGMSLGYTKFRRTAIDPFGNPTTADATLDAGTLGVLVDYNWTQGPSQRFVVGTGVGAKRILASRERREPLDLDRAYVTARFVVGLLF